VPVEGWRLSNSWPRLAWRCGDGAASVVVDSVEGSWCDAVLRVKLGCGMGQTCNCSAPVWCGTATGCGAPRRAFGAVVALAICDGCRRCVWPPLFGVAQSSGPFAGAGLAVADGDRRRRTG
jgi:hypothetical protein